MTDIEQFDRSGIHQNDRFPAGPIPNSPGLHLRHRLPEHCFRKKRNAVRIGDIEQQRQQRGDGKQQQHIPYPKLSDLFDFLPKHFLEPDAGHFQQANLLAGLGQIGDSPPQFFVGPEQIGIEGLNGFIGPDIF